MLYKRVNFRLGKSLSFKAIISWLIIWDWNSIHLGIIFSLNWIYFLNFWTIVIGTLLLGFEIIPRNLSIRIIISISILGLDIWLFWSIMNSCVIWHFNMFHWIRMIGSWIRIIHRLISILWTGIVVSVLYCLVL